MEPGQGWLAGAGHHCRDQAGRRNAFPWRHRVRATQQRRAGGDEATYIKAFLEARKVVMKEEAHRDTSRVGTEQMVFLDAGNFDLNPPLRWKVYGDSYSIAG
nr:chitosanase [Streptomyces rubellomurinus]